MKRTSTSAPNANGHRQERFERLALTPSPIPANDTDEWRAALIALVDDLATFTVGLYFTDRLPEEKRDGRDGQRGKPAPR